MKKQITILSLVCMFVVSLVGCNMLNGSKGNGNQITFSMFSAPKGLYNPMMYEDQYDSYVVQYLFDSLWGYDDKVQISTEKGLADSYMFSDDNKFLTIKLKKGPKWHDGKPVTIDDVIFTWEALADKNYKGVRFSNVAMIKGAEAKKEGRADAISGITRIDDYTVKVEFDIPEANVLANLWTTPIPKHIFEKVSLAEFGNDPATRKNIVGNGPFKLKESRANEYVTLEKNPDYYRGAPKLDKIVLKVLSQDVAIAALQKNEIDFLSQIAPREARELRKDKDLVITENDDFAYQYMGLNNASPKLKDKRVRQAITHAINREALVDGLLEGKGYVLNQHMPPASWAYNQSLKNAYPYDLKKAKQLLLEAGYKDVNGDGFVEDPQGNSYVLKLDYPTGNPVRERSAPIIAEDIKKAGINVQLAQPREATSHYNNIQQGKSEMYLAGWSLTPDPDPSGIWQSKDDFNYINYKNRESDRLIRAAVTSKEAFTQEGRKQLYNKWTALISEEAPQVFLYGQKSIDAHNKRIHGVTTDWRGVVIEDCINWYIPKDKQ